ncbi:MAG: hypothetical protein ACMUIE_04445 [Thermoplasmatota archaeon]
MSADRKRIIHVSKEIRELMNELEEDYLLLGGDEVLAELNSLKSAKKS